MKVPHPDLSEVTWMILVDICPMVVLTTGHTAATGVLAVLAYTTVAGGDVAATVGEG
jgi:hypothetical protein